jgi:hypothetical protein
MAVKQRTVAVAVREMNLIKFQEYKKIKTLIFLIGLAV